MTQAASSAGPVRPGTPSARPDAAARAFGITPEDYMLPTRGQIQIIDQQGRVRPVAEQGTAPGHEYPLPEGSELLAAYERLVIGRRVNDQNSALVRQGRMAVYPSSHGQEACQVAAALCLRRGRLAVPHLPRLRGRDDQGRGSGGGHDHLPRRLARRLRPHQHKVGIQCTPLTTQLLHAVGVAHAAKLRGEDTVVLAMCGDGATSEGDFHEALNFAAVFQLPVVFFVQNNGYAISVPLSAADRRPVAGPQGRGLRHGRRARGRQRPGGAAGGPGPGAWSWPATGSGPLLVEAHTYRMQAHTNADDATRYREDAEVQAWLAKDPVARMRAYLTRRGLLDDAGEDASPPRPRTSPPPCATA